MLSLGLIPFSLGLILVLSSFHHASNLPLASHQSDGYPVRGCSCQSSERALGPAPTDPSGSRGFGTFWTAIEGTEDN